MTMSEPITTASALERNAKCLLSALLPKVLRESADATAGTAKHAYLADALDSGAPEQALERVPAEYRDECASLDLSQLPAGYPGTCAAEVAFAFDVETGAGRELGRGLGRDYQGLADTEIPSTADVVALEGSDAVAIYDYKTGWGRQPRAAESWQLRFLALAACRAYGRSRASVAIIRVGEDGAYYDRAEFDECDLLVTEGDVSELFVDIEIALKNPASIASVPAVPGDHCKYCPGFEHCPAQAALIRAASGAPAELGVEGIVLTPETAAAAWRRIKDVERVLDATKTAIQAYAQLAPIPLGDGYELGAVQQSRERVDGVRAHRVLVERYGEDIAGSAVEWKSSKAAIERALRPLVTKERKISALKEEALEALRAAGAVEEKTFTLVKEMRSK